MNDEQEDADVFVRALPEHLSADASENQENFQRISCEGFDVSEWMSCMAWQPNEIPHMGATEKYPRFSAGNLASITWTDISATTNNEKMITTKLILSGAASLMNLSNVVAMTTTILICSALTIF